MGVQENQNCTVITMRMSGGRKRWSVDGGNHMAKILYTKENNELLKAVNETPIQVDIKDIILVFKRFYLKDYILPPNS